jgi:hypothetical protein
MSRATERWADREGFQLVFVNQGQVKVTAASDAARLEQFALMVQHDQQVTYMYSDTGGATWSKPAALTPRPFKAGWGNDTSQPNLGDYNQAVAHGGTLYAAYAATTQVGFADGQPSTTMTTPDVLVTKVTSGVVTPSLRPGAVTFTETGGDGNIDPGDQVRLKIPLENYITNPLNAATVSGISGTLSTATAGVSLVQASSRLPRCRPWRDQPEFERFHPASFGRIRSGDSH